MRRMKPWLMMAAALGLAAAGARANNLQLSNVTVTPKDDTTAIVQFDLSWENSWRYTGINHDAAWVFFKVQQDNHGDMSDWMHAILDGAGSNPTGYDTGSGTPIEIIVPTDPPGAGMFVRRSGEGEGTVNVTGIKAVWNFASNGIPKAGKVKVQAFGVEMVYVAEGEFAAGGIGTEVAKFTLTTINTANATNAPTGSGSLGGQAGGYPTGQTAPTSASWPNGYASFYCMKYEITQGQYKDFLNTLTRVQQATRVTASVTVSNYMSSTLGGSTTEPSRNTVRLTGDSGDPLPRVYTTVTPDRACNWLSWADGAAFAAWAGLRPMSELEFEKACRGPLEAVAEEFAWGSVDYTALSGLQGTDGSGTETYSAGNLHASGNGGPAGPVRVGIFATPGSTRISAGASYWGIMELSGNVFDRAVTIGLLTGRVFTGLHGNGVLTSAGEADVSGWPGSNAAGSSFRGGSLGNVISWSRLADRTDGAHGNGIRASNFGWRAVRTAPAGVGP